MYRLVVTFIFPLVLVIAERVAREFAHNEAKKFVAPTVLAIALGLLCPLLATEDLTKHLPRRIRGKAAGTVTVNRNAGERVVCSRRDSFQRSKSQAGKSVFQGTR